MSKKKKAGKSKSKIDWKDKRNKACADLAMWGFSVKAIAKETGLTENQVNYRLQKLGIRISDYRNLIFKSKAVKEVWDEAWKKFMVDSLFDPDATLDAAFNAVLEKIEKEDAENKKRKSKKDK